MASATILIEPRGLGKGHYKSVKNAQLLNSGKSERERKGKRKGGKERGKDRRIRRKENGMNGD